MQIKPSDISVVIQGRVDPIATKRCVDSIRRILPHAEIILSTWKNQPISALAYDMLVENDDPGATEWHQSTARNNTNRQIVSTKNGIAKSSRPYVLKIRSDAHLESANFLNYFGRYPKRHPEWSFLKHKVIASTLFSGHPHHSPFTLFCPSDWFHFGLREDVQAIWDLPLYPEPETTTWFVNRPRPSPDLNPHSFSRYHPEQMIWLGCLRKFKPIPMEHHADNSPEKLLWSEQALAGNLILLHPWQAGIRMQKYQELEQTGDGRKDLYSHRDWFELYKQHCDPDVNYFTSLPMLDLVRAPFKKLSAKILMKLK